MKRINPKERYETDIFLSFPVNPGPMNAHVWNNMNGKETKIPKKSPVLICAVNASMGEKKYAVSMFDFSIMMVNTFGAKKKPITDMIAIHNIE